MPTSPTNFKAELRTAMRDLLWRQWSCLGAGLQELDGAPSPEGNIIDPEALLLATTVFGRQDQRLFDEALDWVVRFGALINVQRLKNLHADGELGHERALGAVAAYVKRHGKLPKWGTLAKTDSVQSPSEPEPFFESSGIAAAHRGVTDPDFLAHGWLRGMPRQKELAMPPSPERVANVLLTLRALIGVSSRCEIILCLLTRSSARPAELARLTSYSAQAIQAVLNEMVLSGNVRTDGTRTSTARQKTGRGVSLRYYLQPQDWQFLLPAKASPRWLPWAALFALVQGVDAALSTVTDELLLSMQLRRLMEKHSQQLAEGITHQLSYHADMTGEALLKCLATDLPRLIQTI
jgi:hypothetical protein